MAPDVERSAKSAAQSKLLTMDVVELTLLLKSIGFRLESIDYDEFRNWGKKSNDCGNGSIGGASATTIHSARPDADHHYINVEIACSKSKIVSHLSFKINENDTAATDATHGQTHSMTDSANKLMVCSCPKREPRNDNNSFWEVQSSGTFANQRRSINALMNSEAGIDHDTSSNLLPTLSNKSIVMTHVLTQVLLNQYKINTQFGESNAKDVDIKSIMRAIEKTSVVSTMDSGKVGKLPSVSQVEDLNLITPLSSMVTPNEQEGIMNVTIPKVTVNDRNTDEFAGRTTALNETVNTEAFSSPKSDLITSSPHASVSSFQTGERDTSIINLLNRARHSIDQALLSMRLNVTRNISQEMLTPSSTTAQDNLNRFAASQSARMLNGRNTSHVAVNARPPLTALNRRASVGSTTSKVSAKVVIPATRINGSKTNSTANRENSSSKISLVRRAVSGISSVNRTIGAVNGSSKTSTVQQSNMVKRTASVQRRLSSPAISSTGIPPINGVMTRKTASTTKLTPLPSKLAKK